MYSKKTKAFDKTYEQRLHELKSLNVSNDRWWKLLNSSDKLECSVLKILESKRKNVLLETN